MTSKHMNGNNWLLTTLAGIALAVLLSMGPGPANAEPNEQADQTIQHLIDRVSGSGLTFIRNASEYTPLEAAEHMNRKYQHFRDRIETPEDFIELCATRSLLSGKPYLVIAGQGKQVRTSDWLRAELAAYQVQGH
jgi:hypothetical protein